MSENDFNCDFETGALRPTNHEFIKIMDSINKSEIPKDAKKNKYCRLNGLCEYYHDCFPSEESLPDDSILTLVSSQNKNKMYEADIEYLKAAIADVKGGNIVLEEIERQSKKGRTTIPAIINEILSVVNYTRESDTYYSYQGWLKKVYDNYAQTKRLQDILSENKENTVILNFKNIGVQTPHYVEENVDVSGQPFVEEINTVIAVDKNGQIITEKGNERFNSATIFNTGTMGLLLTNANGNPIIARFAEANGVTKRSAKALWVFG